MRTPQPTPRPRRSLRPPRPPPPSPRHTASPWSSAARSAWPAVPAAGRDRPAAHATGPAPTRRNTARPRTAEPADRPGPLVHVEEQHHPLAPVRDVGQVLQEDRGEDRHRIHHQLHIVMAAQPHVEGCPHPVRAQRDLLRIDRPDECPDPGHHAQPDQSHLRRHGARRRGGLYGCGPVAQRVRLRCGDRALGLVPALAVGRRLLVDFFSGCPCRPSRALTASIASTVSCTSSSTNAVTTEVCSRAVDSHCRTRVDLPTPPLPRTWNRNGKSASSGSLAKVSRKTASSPRRPTNPARPRRRLTSCRDGRRPATHPTPG